MKNVKIVAMLLIRTLFWTIGFSFLLAVVNILIPKYAPAISFLLSALFIERGTRKRKKQYAHPFVSPFLLSTMSAPIAYELTSGICALTLKWSIPQKYCYKELYGELAVIEGVMLMLPWFFLFLIFLWFRVIFRKKYFPE